MDKKELRQKISKTLFSYETEYGKKCVDDIIAIVDEHETEQLRIGSVSHQMVLLVGFAVMREFDVMHENIEESVDYFLKNKETYL